MRTNLISMNVGMWITTVLLFGNQELGIMGAWIFLGITALMSVWLFFTRNKSKKDQQDL